MRANGRSPTSAIAPPAPVANNNFNGSGISNSHYRNEDVNRASVLQYDFLGIKIRARNLRAAENVLGLPQMPIKPRILEWLLQIPTHARHTRAGNLGQKPFLRCKHFTCQGLYSVPGISQSEGQPLREIDEESFHGPVSWRGPCRVPTVTSRSWTKSLTVMRGENAPILRRAAVPIAARRSGAASAHRRIPASASTSPHGNI